MRKWSSHHVTIAPLLLLKEKWLGEDPEKVSVLKHVATFKDRLLRAGQKTKRNLQESQSKMNVWYDRKAKSRYRFCSLLYVTPCKQSTLDLIKWLRKLVTQTTWSELLVDVRKQVCHINMLKAYHKKPKPELVLLNNKLGLENPMHGESCVGLEAEKEEDNESEVRLENDQQPIKLQNSQILNNLNTKLSHLPSVKRKELAEVINQYREEFRDPNKTNLIA